MLRRSMPRPFLREAPEEDEMRGPSQQRLRATDGNGEGPECWGAGRILRILEVSRPNVMEEETLVPEEC